MLLLRGGRSALQGVKMASWLSTAPVLSETSRAPCVPGLLGLLQQRFELSEAASKARVETLEPCGSDDLLHPERQILHAFSLSASWFRATGSVCIRGSAALPPPHDVPCSASLQLPRPARDHAVPASSGVESSHTATDRSPPWPLW